MLNFLKNYRDQRLTFLWYFDFTCGGAIVLGDLSIGGLSAHRGTCRRYRLNGAAEVTAVQYDIAISLTDKSAHLGALGTELDVALKGTVLKGKGAARFDDSDKSADVGQLSVALGQKRMNLWKLREMGYEIEIRPDSTLSGRTYRIENSGR